MQKNMSFYAYLLVGISLMSIVLNGMEKKNCTQDTHCADADDGIYALRIAPTLKALAFNQVLVLNKTGKINQIQLERLPKELKKRIEKIEGINPLSDALNGCQKETYYSSSELVPYLIQDTYLIELFIGKTQHNALQKRVAIQNILLTCNCDRSIVKWFSDQGVKVAKLKKSDGLTMLHWAASKAKIDIAQYLLEQGALINDAANGLGTPLYYATQYGKSDMVKFLLEKGADKDIKGSKGTPLEIARDPENTFQHNKEDMSAIITLLSAESPKTAPLAMNLRQTESYELALDFKKTGWRIS